MICYRIESLLYAQKQQSKLQNKVEGNECLSMEESLSQLSTTIQGRLWINAENVHSSSVAEEIKCFLMTGNVQSIANGLLFLNPTLVNGIKTAEKEHCQVNHLACPFDAYFPIPLNDQLSSSDATQEMTSIYIYCKSKLQSLVSELRSLKHRIVFHFHFGDSIKLCLANEKMKNAFHIVHCSELGDIIGLANLLPAASRCLIQDNQETFILTETTAWFHSTSSSVTDYVEMSLGCPLSLIPTLYGLRLANHLQLGSPVCVAMHDTSSTNSVTLKWLQTAEYSSNIILDISSDLQDAITRLAELCFIHPPTPLCCYFPPQSPLPYTPLTYYLVFQSVVKRCFWVDNNEEDLFQHSVASSLRATWLTRKRLAKRRSCQIVHLYSSLIAKTDAEKQQALGDTLHWRKRT